MNKYIILGYPEVQKFMDNERWSECRALISDNSEYAIPEDLYEEVMYKLQFPKKYENTNLGTVVLYETRAIVNGTETFWYDHNPKKGDLILLYNHNTENWKIVTCVANQEGFPILVNDKGVAIGIFDEFIGSYNPEIKSE